jgi:hypothetical protein
MSSEELLAGYSRLLLLIILQGGLFTVEVSSLVCVGGFGGGTPFAEFLMYRHARTPTNALGSHPHYLTFIQVKLMEW